MLHGYDAEKEIEFAIAAFDCSMGVCLWTLLAPCRRCDVLVYAIIRDVAEKVLSLTRT